jgi:hypothetical protein
MNIITQVFGNSEEFDMDNVAIFLANNSDILDKLNLLTVKLNKCLEEKSIDFDHLKTDIDELKLLIKNKVENKKDKVENKKDKVERRSLLKEKRKNN